MPVLTGPLRPEGALVDARISMSHTQVRQLRFAGRPIPAPVLLRGMLDTGAESTCVEPRAVAALALPFKAIGLANLPAGGGLTLGPQFEAALTVIHPSGDPRRDLVVPDLLVTELPLGALGYEVLIGRDVLDLWRFLYHGPRRRFRLAY
jgi:hypothetical protein